MEQLRKKYEKQVDLMQKKPRFGYFSIFPSHTAAKTDYNWKKCYKDHDGKVITQQRNIYGGSSSRGILKKTYFSLPKSIYQDDPYTKQENSKKKMWLQQNKNKQLFIPAMFNKTLSTAAYKYQCQNPIPKNIRIHRKDDGGVKIQDPNIYTNTLTKITSQKNKYFQYKENPYDDQKKLRNEQRKMSIKLRIGEFPFKIHTSSKQHFTNNYNTFNDHQIKKKQKRIFSSIPKSSISHEDAFKTSGRPMTGLFSYPKHQPEMQEKKICKITKNKGQVFKSMSKGFSSKPSPSIALSMMNVINKMR